VNASPRPQRADVSARHDDRVTTLGVIFPPDLPPERLRPVARAADEAGLEQLWLWEDCFAESGIATAAAALAWTERLTVGIGLLPVPLRNVALTAMEIATLERLFPGRVMPGVGHGVLDWMGKVGARAESPMTLLREYTAALRALLHGQTVDVAGRYVQLTDVALQWAPVPPPPLLVGAVRERTVMLAGELGDGVIFTGQTSPEALLTVLPHLRIGRDRARAPGEADVVVFAPVQARTAAAEVAAQVGQLAAAGATHVILHAVGDGVALEQFAEMIARDVRALVP
jgi:alkanesulfonate monooxygenase SsuD/methylene tetrahydromethanopterin reductase-like flavin-dependent oxidoreductase (luciferase family)